MKLFTLSLACCIYSICAHAQSPYINRVYDFSPAPGQYVNELPEYEDGDTHADIIQKVEECIAANNKVLISLGGYGGSVTFGFDHMVENKPEKYDFRILGNAFYANTNPTQGASAEGGSCEPGIVMVAHDANGNGIPDDPWYELAGSEYHKPQTIKNYRINYYKPSDDKIPTPDNNNPSLNDTTYIRWKSNQGDSGYMSRNSFHHQSYYPLWEKNDSLTFEGTKLPNNYIDESGVGSFFVLYAYRWGYADNHPNSYDRSAYDINWAVDASGNLAHLPGIHFVKVYTGVNQYCGWLGETSTEIMGAEDLHLKGNDIPVATYTEGIRINTTDTTLNIGKQGQLSAIVFSSTPSLETVVWNTNDSQTVTVSSEGIITAVGVGRAIVTASTTDGRFAHACSVKVAIPASNTPDSPKPLSAAIYHGGTLRLLHLNAHACSVIAVNGSILSTFTVDSDNEIRHPNLTSGIYILKATRRNEVKVFKFMVQ